VKILYHHRTRAEDAQGIHIREIVRGMRELGHEVRVVALAGEGEGTATGGKVDVGGKGSGERSPFVYEVMTLAYNLYGFLMLARAILTFRPAMIYERYSLNTFCGILASKLFRIPLVLEVNAPLSYEQKKYGRIALPKLATFLERWICSRATATIVVSGVLKEMLASIGVPLDQMVVVPNGIDPDVFHPGVSGDAVRQRYGIEEKIVLGFTGWFKKWHGLGMLLELFDEEKWGRENVHLLLVGDGPARKELEAQIARLGIDGHVTITGPVPREEMARHVAAFDISLQPDVTEYASPMKIFEYMGLGKCIVAPEQPNITEILDNGTTAMLFRPGDKEDLRKILWRAIGGKETRESLGRNAREAVFNRGFLWKENARKAVALAFPEEPGANMRR
jgi:glycosyltransferase involved in cell wall biosynthesis